MNGILCGSGTIGDGDLLDEALDICEDLDQIDLKGQAATFGSDDTMYEAVNTIGSKLAERGAEIVFLVLRWILRCRTAK
ncbi:hypothetical protein QS257_21105 [Terrilactibacillus sp. S3-3]|nr:hypothetical protein QS257_21105 [Terrilactibacillus sp. S3-3]